MPVINGAHSIIYSSNAEADRALLHDVLGLPNVEVGQGSLISRFHRRKSRFTRRTRTATSCI